MTSDNDQANAGPTEPPIPSADRPEASSAVRSTVGHRRRWPRTRVIFVAALSMLAFIVLAVWLIQPSPKAAFAVSARTGTLTIEPLCGERLVWDLPAGRIVRRSSLPGAGKEGAGDASTGNLTLVLMTGARARLESTGAGVLRITVGRAANIDRACATGGALFYELTVAGVSVPDDPMGFTYMAAPGPGPSRSPLSLLLSGHVLLGEAIQQGAGWDTEAGILESGTVDLRVVPWFGDDRVTLRTEALEEGSLFDTHACLTAAAAVGPRHDCPSSTAKPALGFLRTLSDGGMSVQLYVQGAVGTQSFGGDQRVLEISQSTAAWHSPALATLVSLLLIFFALYQGVKTVARDSLGWWRGEKTPSRDHEGELAAEATHAAIERTREGEKEHRGSPASHRSGTAAGRTVAAIVLACSASSAFAEPVEIRQGTSVGAGYSFRRGASCLVVTARHVVPEMGAAVTVLDRAGAKAQGSRGYDNDFYDLALITVPDNALIACTTSWPESAWMARASFSSMGEFRVVRHYSNGRETIVRMQYAGGLRHQLTLAPVDKLTIRESDSGAMVEAGGRPVGIVQSVDTSTDRVNVLRFDQIDQLVGDRFRRRTVSSPLSYAGVFFRGRQNAEWSTYVQSWLTEQAGRTLVVIEPQPYGRPDPRKPATPSTTDVPKTSCEVKVEVMSWERLSVPNPDFSKVELGLEACRKRGFVFEQLCAAARNSQRNTPRMIQSQKLTFNVSITPRGAPALTKLETSTVMPPSGERLGRTELELAVLQAAVGPTLKAMLESAPCQ